MLRQEPFKKHVNDRKTQLTLQVDCEVDPVLCGGVGAHHGRELGLLLVCGGWVEQAVQLRVRVVHASTDVVGVEPSDNGSLEPALANDANLTVRQLNTWAATSEHAKDIARVLRVGEDRNARTMPRPRVTVQSEMQRRVGKSKGGKHKLRRAQRLVCVI